MKSKLVKALSSSIPKNLAEDLVSNFISIRQDVALKTLGRSAPGKFVETVVQVMQFLHSGSYDAKPDVDKFLRSIQSTQSSLDDGLKICGARIARSMYALRSKRNIVHKGSVDPNIYDLEYIHHGAQWILAEIIRLCSGVPMKEAGKLVEHILTPIGSIIEDFGGRKLILANLSAKEEILLVLHSVYPEAMEKENIVKSIDRKNPKTVTNALRELWKLKLVENISSGYVLTKLGLNEAVQTVILNNLN